MNQGGDMQVWMRSMMDVVVGNRRCLDEGNRKMDNMERKIRKLERMVERLLEELISARGGNGYDAAQSATSQSDMPCGLHQPAEVVEPSNDAVKVEPELEPQPESVTFQVLSGDVGPSRPKVTIVHSEEPDKHFETQEDWKVGIFDEDKEETSEDREGNKTENISPESKTLAEGERKKQEKKTMNIPSAVNNPVHNICTFCSYKAASNSKLMTHIRTHTGEKPYACDFCPQTFAHKSNLKRHLNAIHLGMQPYVCSVCGRQFPKSAILTRHMEVHNVR